MDFNQGVLFELKQETDNTRRIVECFKDADLTWKPHDKSMSVGELAAHVVELHNWVNLALSKEVFDFAIDYTPLQGKSVVELLQILDAGYNENVALINQMNANDWASNWTLRSGDYKIMESPKTGVFRFVIQNHLIHHRGQLSLYLRLLDIAVPGIYGPSADDKNKA